MLPYTQEELDIFMSDGTKKALEIQWYRTLDDGVQKHSAWFSNGMIESESFTLSESLCSRDNFKFGVIEKSSISFTWHNCYNLSDSFKKQYPGWGELKPGTLLNVFLRAADENGWPVWIDDDTQIEDIHLGIFYVDSVQEDLLTGTQQITAYSKEIGSDSMMKSFDEWKSSESYAVKNYSSVYTMTQYHGPKVYYDIFSYLATADPDLNLPSELVIKHSLANTTTEWSAYLDTSDRGESHGYYSYPKGATYPTVKIQYNPNTEYGATMNSGGYYVPYYGLHEAYYGWLELKEAFKSLVEEVSTYLSDDMLYDFQMMCTPGIVDTNAKINDDHPNFFPFFDISSYGNDECDVRFYIGYLNTRESSDSNFFSFKYANYTQVSGSMAGIQVTVTNVDKGTSVTKTLKTNRRFTANTLKGYRYYINPNYIPNGVSLNVYQPFNYLDLDDAKDNGHYIRNVFMPCPVSAIGTDDSNTYVFTEDFRWDVSSLLADLAEMNTVFYMLDRGEQFVEKRLFEGDPLYPSESLTPNDDLYPSSGYFDISYDANKIKSISETYTNNQPFSDLIYNTMSLSRSMDSSTNLLGYDISYNEKHVGINPNIKYKEYDLRSNNVLNYMGATSQPYYVNRLAELINIIILNSLSITMVANPYSEPGDMIEIDLKHNKTLRGIIYDRTMSGIQHLEDSITT